MNDFSLSLLLAFSSLTAVVISALFLLLLLFDPLKELNFLPFKGFMEWREDKMTSDGKLNRDDNLLIEKRIISAGKKYIPLTSGTKVRRYPPPIHPSDDVTRIS